MSVRTFLAMMIDSRGTRYRVRMESVDRGFDAKGSEERSVADSVQIRVV